MSSFPVAQMADGTTYTGNQQYQGLGIVKWCAICGTHRPQLGGTLRNVMGARHWVCARHPKPGASKK